MRVVAFLTEPAVVDYLKLTFVAEKPTPEAVHLQYRRLSCGRPEIQSAFFAAALRKLRSSRSLGRPQDSLFLINAARPM